MGAAKKRVTTSYSLDVGKTVCDYGYDATLWKVEVPEGVWSTELMMGSVVKCHTQRLTGHIQ